MLARCPLEDLVSSPSQLDGRLIGLRHNVAELNIDLLQTLLQVPDMTQLALGKLTGVPLLCPKRLNEAIPTAVKVGVSHQDEPQIPIR
jgi:hypothetical protein